MKPNALLGFPVLNVFVMKELGEGRTVHVTGTDDGRDTDYTATCTGPFDGDKAQIKGKYAGEGIDIEGEKTAEGIHYTSKSGVPVDATSRGNELAGKIDNKPVEESVTRFNDSGHEMFMVRYNISGQNYFVHTRRPEPGDRTPDREGSKLAGSVDADCVATLETEGNKRVQKTRLNGSYEGGAGCNETITIDSRYGDYTLNRIRMGIRG